MKKEDLNLCFFSDDSGRSVLNTWKKKECVEGGSKSIITIAKDLGLQKFIYISPNFHSFVQCMKNAEEENLQMVFGLEVLMCADRHVHSEESVATNHKVILFMKNSAGYKDLIKLYSAWKTEKENKYYKYRFDFKGLKQHFTQNMILAIPFFNSFLYTNTFIHGANIVPDYSTEELVLMREIGSEHPHEYLTNLAIDNFNKDRKYKEINTKTAFCENRADFDALTVFRTIHEKTEYHKPELPFFCSDAFCVESYKELVK